MNEQCDICKFPRKASHRLLETDAWHVQLGNNQAYFGRAYVTLKEHKGSLSALSPQEWQEFQDIVGKLEPAYKELYGADPLNWSCLMNNAFRENPAYPHVHWHVMPRYRTPVVRDGVTYVDSQYGELFDGDAERLVSDEIVASIATELRSYLASH
jgi:diadenosine tetraphosphate (Ap4A) HIT family hydrolase